MHQPKPEPTRPGYATPSGSRRIEINSPDFRRVESAAEPHLRAALIDIANQQLDAALASITRAFIAAHPPPTELNTFDLTLGEIGITSRIAHQLERTLGIVTVRDLLNHTPEQLAAVPNIAETSLKNIHRAVKELGLK
jgi:DNA-directed RNA polymerase alpha subunit